MDTLNAIRSQLSKYPETLYIYIEDKANGAAIIDSLSHEFSGVVPVTPEGGKNSRAAAVSHILGSWHLHLPEYASWLEDYLKERRHSQLVNTTTRWTRRHKH